MSENVRPMRTKCRNCGQEIFLIKTDRGKTLPFDREEVKFVLGDDRNGRRFITQSGELWRGEVAGDGEKEYDKITGWPCHFDTCKYGRKGVKR